MSIYLERSAMKHWTGPWRVGQAEGAPRHEVLKYVLRSLAKASGAGEQRCSISRSKLRLAKWARLKRARPGRPQKGNRILFKSNGDVFKKGTNKDRFRILRVCGGHYIEKIQSGCGKTGLEAANQGRLILCCSSCPVC